MRNRLERWCHLCMEHRRCLQKLVRNGSTGSDRTMSLTDHVWAVVLIIALALLALQASLNLGTDTNTVANLHR